MLASCSTASSVLPLVASVAAKLVDVISGSDESSIFRLEFVLVSSETGPNLLLARDASIVP